LHDHAECLTETEIAAEDRASQVVAREVASTGSAEEVQMTVLESDEKIFHWSILGRMKKLGGKVRKLVRVMRTSSLSVGDQNEGMKEVCADLVNFQDAVTQTSPKIQSQPSPRLRLDPTSSYPPVLDNPPRHQPQSPRLMPSRSSRPRPLSLSFPSMGGNIPGYPFIVPVIYVSSPASSPPCLSVPTFSVTSSSKFRSSKVFPEAASLTETETESSPTPTVQVEPKAPVMSKTEITGNSGAVNATDRSPESSSSSTPTAIRVETRPTKEREMLRRRRATFSFNRLSSILGWEGVHV